MKDDGHTRGERSDLTLTVDSRATCDYHEQWRGESAVHRTAVRRRGGASGGEGQQQHHWRNYGLRWLAGCWLYGYG